MTTATESNGEQMAYIGRAICGCVVAAAIDTPEHRRQTARETARWIRDGLTLERVTVAEVRTRLRACPHKPERRRTLPPASQPTLL